MLLCADFFFFLKAALSADPSHPPATPLVTPTPHGHARGMNITSASRVKRTLPNIGHRLCYRYMSSRVVEVLSTKFVHAVCPELQNLVSLVRGLLLAVSAVMQRINPRQTPHRQTPHLCREPSCGEPNKALCSGKETIRRGIPIGHGTQLERPWHRPRAAPACWQGRFC
jgi:hypothetical protein